MWCTACVTVSSSLSVQHSVPVAPLLAAFLSGDTVDSAVLLPFLLDPSVACGPVAPSLPDWVHAASEFLRAVGTGLITAPLSAQCVAGASAPAPSTDGSPARGLCPPRYG
jgi:hypothetical protein